MVKSARNISRQNPRKTRKKCVSKQFQNTKTTIIDETFRGKCFFRKYGGSKPEHAIYKILKQNPHPNIVKVYRITDSYVDIEMLTPVIGEKDYDKQTLISSALESKKHLQKLGIMYIDWKPDNIGIGDDGKYKLFDFDASGITTSTGRKWRIKPPFYLWSYKQAFLNGVKDPKEIDDFAFDINFNIDDYVELDDKDLPLIY